MIVAMPVLVVRTRTSNSSGRRMRMMPAAPGKRVCQQDGSGQKHKGSIHDSPGS